MNRLIVNKTFLYGISIKRLLIVIILVHCANADCNPRHCNQCLDDDDNECQTCDSGYIVFGAVCCDQLCLNCTASSLSGICNACVNSSYAINNSTYQCEACSTLISNCLECTSQSSCTVCVTNYTSNGTACFNCAQAMDGCVACTSATVCTACANSSVAINSSNSQCVACSSLLVGCSTCTSEIFCTLCLNASFALNNATNACDPCALMPQCSTCSSASVCTACVNDSFALNSSLCTVCESVLLGCLHCSSSSECIDCVNNTFAFNASNSQCVACSAFMPFCTSCNSSAVCVSCEGGPNIVLFNQNCASCSAVIPNCLNCSSSNQCTVCGKHYIVNLTSLCSLCSNAMYGCMDCSSTTVCTKCSFGQSVINGCSSSPGCIEVNQTGINATCTRCNPSFYDSVPVNGKCLCLKGHMAGQYCSEMIGCTNIIRNNNGNTCTICDSSKKFIISNGTCICPSYYEVHSQTCVEICGDGRLIYLPCDDGNTLNGDGCSSTCQIETGYLCKDGTISHPSNCLFKGMVKLQYICTYKMDDNIAHILLTTNPFIPNIVKSTPIFYIHSQKNITLKQSQLIGSNIQLQLTYLQNIQGSSLNITIQYDRNYILSPNDTIHIQLYQCNGQRLYYDPSPTTNLKFIIAWTIKILAALVVVVWLIGSYSHKMIGVETLHTFQLIVIPHAFANRYFPVVIYFSELCNTLSLYQAKFTPQPALDKIYENRLKYSADFIYSDSVIAIIQITILLLYSVFFLYQKFNQQPDDQQISQKRHKQKGCIEKMDQFKSFFYDFLVFPAFIGFFLNLFLSLMVHSNATIQKNYTNQGIQTIVILLAVIPTSFIYFWEWKKLLAKQKNLETEETYKQNYVPIYLTNFFVLCLLVQGSVSSIFSWPIFGLARFTFIYTSIIMFYRPYHSWVHNLGLFINHIGVLLNLCWILSQEFVYLTRAKEQMIAIILLGWMLLILIFAIIRIICELKRKRNIEQKIKKEKQSKISMIRYKDYETKMRRAILEQTSTNINAYLITSQLINSKRDEDLQLAIKKQKQIAFENKQRQKRQKIMRERRKNPIRKVVRGFANEEDIQ